jgi:hypothetical protein
MAKGNMEPNGENRSNTATGIMGRVISLLDKCIDILSTLIKRIEPKPETQLLAVVLIGIVILACICILLKTVFKGPDNYFIVIVVTLCFMFMISFLYAFKITSAREGAEQLSRRMQYIQDTKSINLDEQSDE